MERYVVILALSSGFAILTRLKYWVLFPYSTRLSYCFNRVFSNLVIRAAHAAQRCKRLGLPLTPLRCVRGSESHH